MRLKQDKLAKSLAYNFYGEKIVKKKYKNFIKQKLKTKEMVRISLHSKSSDLTQCMIIGITKNKKKKSHKNKKKDKIYLILQGKIKFQIKNKQVILKKGDFLKLKQNNFMSMKSVSKIALYIEIIAGPFKKGDTIYEN